jgi:hypothetical protein
MVFTAARPLRIFVGLFSLMCLGQARAEALREPPFRLFYSNDATHILSNVSPYHGEKETKFTEAMLRASVDEAAVPGMGAQLLQPGTGWVPWWPSKIDPIKEHLEWFHSHYSKSANYPVLDYLAAGGDLIGPFVEECHKRGDAAFVSFRINDVHLLENYDKPSPPYGTIYAVSRFYVEHPELRLGAPPPPPAQQGRTHNWLMPEARAYKLSLIKEILSQYDLDGLELDFMRYPADFPPGTPLSEKVSVMTGFVREVRAALDQTAHNGKRRWLMIRVPGYRVDPVKHFDWEAVGFDPAAFRAAGVDIFNLSPFYTMSQQTDIAAVRAAAPDAFIYLELTHTPQTWWIAVTANDGFDHRRSTKEMLETTARLAYRRGADGVTIFNFPYYREYGPVRDQRGPFNEPPFHYLPALAHPAALEKEAPSYFYLARKGDSFGPGHSRSYSMDMAPVAHDGLLRLQVLTDAETKQGEGRPPEKVDRGKWTVKLNGQELAATQGPASAYPFPTPFTAGFGYPEQYLAWRVPAGLVKDGVNSVQVSSDSNLKLRWIEAWFDSAAH